MTKTKQAYVNNGYANLQFKPKYIKLGDGNFVIYSDRILNGELNTTYICFNKLNNNEGEYINLNY